MAERGRKLSFSLTTLLIWGITRTECVLIPQITFRDVPDLNWRNPFEPFFVEYLNKDI